MISFSPRTAVYTSSLFPSNISHGFGTKQPSPINHDHIITPKQSHSSNVRVVTEKNRYDTSPPATDGLATSAVGVALSVVTADCVPILYGDPVAGIIGISHSGWKGLIENIIGNMIAAMQSIGATGQRIVAIIGPAVGSCCYPIYGQRKALFQNKFGAEVFDTYQDHIGLNLTKAAYLSLIKQGIAPSNIDHTLFCTACQSDIFWSYSRDGTARNHMLHFIKK